MKKILIAFTIIFMSISASAYQQVIYCNPLVGYAGTNVTINATCSYLKFSSSWYDFSGDYSMGSSVCHSNGTLIGEYSWWTGYNTPSYNSAIFYNQYWGTVNMTMSATNCYGESKLEWAL
ncbi:MAG: hypothetical protein J7621_27080 [Niastella sp.]|nr:hypothetical protein [Niastella sp.]